MTKVHIEPDIILKRIAGIQTELSDLHDIKDQSFEDFSTGNGWKLAQFHLHRCLEGVFNISSHLLARIPGGVATKYKEIALKMGEFNLVPKDFAIEKLAKMANYRNRLVHFYAEINPQELYQILQEDLEDFDIFLISIKEVLSDPKKFNL